MRGLTPETTLSYNARGQRIAKTFHGNTPGGTYTYDVLGRMLTNTTANGHTETYTYDARDRQLTAKWNAAGSLAAINVSRTYDAAGRLLTVTQAGATNSSHTYSYNARGENISETQVLFGKTLSFARSYDDDGHLTSLTQPSGRVVNYSNSARGQINGVVSDGPPPLVNYTFDKAGRVTHAWHENGIIEHRQYDALSQLTAINIGTTNQPTSIGVHTYTHDSAGRRTGHNNSGTSVNYTYDNADQVTASTGAIPRSYAYDAAGNRTTATQFGQTLSYTANALNQYTALTNSAAPTYDAAGNTLTINGAVYAYDQKNQLKSISGLDSNGAMVTVNHQYDSMGRRISSTVNNQSILYVYDGWNVVEEYSSSNLQSFDLKTILTWGIDLSGSAQGAGGVGGLLFTEDITSNTTWHHHYDGNGNVTHLTNASGQTVATYTYDAFGNTVTATGVAATANRYRFSTKPIDEHIATTPLYYYGYRYYHPQTGRWINRDPIEEDGGLNLYGFVGNDVNKFDLLGWKDMDSDECNIEIVVGHGTLANPDGTPRVPHSNKSIHWHKIHSKSKCWTTGYIGCNSNRINPPWMPHLDEEDAEGRWDADCSAMKEAALKAAKAAILVAGKMCNKPICCVTWGVRIKLMESMEEEWNKIFNKSGQIGPLHPARKACADLDQLDGKQLFGGICK